MDETLANLMIVLKTVGLNESKVGLRELEGVLRATGLGVEQLAASLSKSSSNLEHVNDLVRANSQANRDAAMFASKVATEQEKVAAMMQRLENAKPHLTVEQYTRALEKLGATSAFVSGNKNPTGFIGPMPEALGPAKPSDATKTSDAITRGLEQERRVRAQLVAEKERENVLNLQAMSLLRQLETPEQAHIRRQAMYNNLLREGYISQTQFTKAVEQSGHAMRTQQSLGTKGGGLAAMQAGYGIQDFATVIAMGGENAFGRAMIAASNNLGQMAVVMGVLNPMLTAAVATSVTLAAVLGPSLFSHFLGDTEEAASNTEKAREEADRYATTLRSLKSELDQARFSFAFGREERLKRQTGAGAESDFVGGLLGDQRNDAVTKFQDRAAALRLEREMNAAQRGDLNTRRTNILRPYLGEFADFNKFGFQNATQAQDAIEQGSGKRPMIPGEVLEESAKIDKELFGLSVTFNDLGDSLARLIEAGKNLLKKQTAEEAQKRSEADTREKTAAQQQERANAIRSSNAARERVLSMLQATRRAAATPSEAAGMESSTSEQDFVNALAGAKDLSNDERRARLSQFYSSRRDQSRKSLEELQQKPEFAPRFSSASEFGRAFQMTLMKPDSKAEKQRDEMIKYHKEQIARLDKLIDKPSGGMVGN